MSSSKPLPREPLTEGDKRGIACLLSARKFPNRSFLRTDEVAKALGISVKHVFSLLSEYQDTGGVSGLLSLDLSSGEGRNPNRRARYRIPVDAYDDFLLRSVNK